LKFIHNESNEFKNSLHSLANKRSFLWGWFWSLFSWFLEGIVIFLCFKAFGLDFDLMLITVLGFSSALFGAISFIPGGIGVTELSLAQILSTYGLEVSIVSAAL